MTTSPAPEADNAVRGTVLDIGYVGSVSIYKVRLTDGGAMKVTLANVAPLDRAPIEPGQEVWLSWEPGAAVMLTE